MAMDNDPRMRQQHSQQSQQSQQSSQQSQSLGPDDSSLQRWMSQQARSHVGPWDLYQSRNFADLWYGARAAGERIRAIALERLYRNRPRPGGSHPDPREPAAFSSRAVLGISAHLLGLQISPTFLTAHKALIFDNRHDSPDSDLDPGAHIDEETGKRLPLAWIAMAPPVAPHAGNRLAPEIRLRSLSSAYQRDTEHEIACLLGFWHHEYVRVIDPDSPGGTILMPREPGIVALLHQYAVALLRLDRDCPPNWDCHCNAIRARFNAPPPGHETPTGAFTVEDLEREAQRPRTDTEPRFPYRDTNPWTE
jgi:hypothetical protein